jgi:probable HAF family extracellular repeat protein
MQDLRTPGDGPSSAHAISASGQVAGAFSTGAGDVHAFRWTPTTGTEDLGTLGSDSGTAINARGQVAGTSYGFGAPEGPRHGFLWTPSLGMRDVGDLGYAHTSVSAMNARGDVVGVSGKNPYEYHAFRSTVPAGMQDLGTLGGANSSAADINARGQVAGQAATAAGRQHAFLWNHDSRAVELGRDDGVGPAPDLDQRGRTCLISTSKLCRPGWCSGSRQSSQQPSADRARQGSIWTTSGRCSFHHSHHQLSPLSMAATNATWLPLCPRASSQSKGVNAVGIRPAIASGIAIAGVGISGTTPHVIATVH